MAMDLMTAPDDLATSNHTAAVFTVGTQYTTPGPVRIRYKYVKVTIGATNANTLIAGRPVYNDVMANGTVLTDDQGTDGSFAGVLQGSVTSGNYTWIIADSDSSPVLVTNALAKGTNLVSSSSAGTLKTQNTTLSATENVVGSNKETGKNPATPLTTLCGFRGK